MLLNPHNMVSFVTTCTEQDTTPHKQAGIREQTLDREKERELLKETL